MGKRKTPEEIQRLLAEADRDLSRGLSVADVCRKLGVSEATYHRWRQRFSAARKTFAALASAQPVLEASG